MEKGKRERTLWLDIARVCAILLVVLCHGAESYYGAVMRGELRVDTGLWVIENTLFTLGRLGVPLFLAITGALLLGRELEPRRFYLHSLLPLVVTTEIWIVINYFFACRFQGIEFDRWMLIREMLFLEAPELSHMWYMPMILGVYVGLPFLAGGIRSVKDARSFRFPMAVGILAFLVLPTANVFLAEAIPGGSKLQTELHLELLGGCYVLYLVCGYLFAQRKLLEGIRTCWLAVAAVAAFGCNTVGQYYLYSYQFYKSTRLLWYNSIFIFIMGVVLFELIRRVFAGRSSTGEGVLRFLSGSSFGVYLLHKPIQLLMLHYLPMDRFLEPAGILILTCVSFAVSILVLWPFWHWFQRIGKWIFLIK